MNVFHRALLSVLAVLAAGAGAAAAQLYEQTFVLQPGWNAVFLEVEPEPREIESALAGVPVKSVWTWRPAESPVEFIRDPAEGLLNVSGWFGYFPRPRPEAFLTNLHILEVNRAYLVELAGTRPVTWRVRGRPSLSEPPWVPNSFNLRGFHVDPQAPPTFGDFFAPSPAHAGQSVYRLDASGVWERVAEPFFTPIRAGEAYWVLSRGPSDYQGPLAVAVDLGGELEYAATLSEQSLVIGNLLDVDVRITVEPLASASPVPLSYSVLDEGTGESSWPALSGPLSFDAGAGDEQMLDLAVRRTELAGARAESLLAVRNGLGSRRLLAVGASAQGTTIFSTANGVAAGSAAVFRAKSAGPFAGLWVGWVTVDAVSEAQRAGTVPTPALHDFSFRLMIHVDAVGQARLLKEVVQMWQNGTLVPDPEDPSFLTVGEPGRFVLVTDEDRIPDFAGAGLRDGQPVGRRLSTAAYDFEDDTLDMQGSFDPAGILSVTLTLGPELPTHPFRHKYHPDHDNLDARFLPNLDEPEVFTVTRDLQLAFRATDPEEQAAPDYGDGVLAGTYRESIAGLHKNTIFVAGTFRLQRVVMTPVLNQ